MTQAEGKLRGSVRVGLEAALAIIRQGKAFTLADVGKGLQEAGYSEKGATPIVNSHTEGYSINIGKPTLFQKNGAAYSLQEGVSLEAAEKYVSGLVPRPRGNGGMSPSRAYSVLEKEAEGHPQQEEIMAHIEAIKGLFLEEATTTEEPPKKPPKKNNRKKDEKKNNKRRTRKNNNKKKAKKNNKKGLCGVCGEPLDEETAVENEGIRLHVDCL